MVTCLVMCKVLVWLHSTIAGKSVKNSIPSRVKLLQPHPSSVETLNFSFENFFRPIKMTLVFPLFIFRPDISPYTSRVFDADCNEC